MSALELRFIRVINREGFFGFLQLLFRKFSLRLWKIIYCLILSPITIPATLIILLISPWVRIRFIMLPSNRVGEYSSGTGVIVHALQYSDDSKTYFYNIPGQPVSNTQLDKMWKRIITVLPFPRIVYEVDRYLMQIGTKYYKNDSFKKFFDARQFDYRDRWHFFKKISECPLKFTAEEILQAKKILSEMGLPENAKYICLLVRDGKYLKTMNPSKDWSYQDHRNASIENYVVSAEWLAEQGYYVIRMGKEVEKPFLVNHSNIIDYANTAFRSDFMDVYLSATCHFFISTSTGLDSIAKIFRRPILITNFSLFDLDIWFPWSIFIPKKIVGRNNNVLSFQSIYQKLGEASKCNTVMQICEEQELYFQENSEQEILQAVKEMLDRVNGNITYSEWDNHSQKKFWELFLSQTFWKNGLSKESPPLFKTSQFNGEYFDLRIGKDFLCSNEFLLNE